MTVHLEHRGRVALVTIDRPERRNAVDHETLLALKRVQAEAMADGSLVLIGAPPAFCAVFGIPAGRRRCGASCRWPRRCAVVGS